MYRFSLEPVLQHRKFQEEELQKDLAALQGALAEEEEDLRCCEELRREVLRDLQTLQERSAAVSEVLVYVTFMEQVSKRLEEKQRRVQETERRLEAKRRDLLLALKNRKILDKLKEKGLRAFTDQANHAEEKFLNEVAIGRFVRTR